MCRLSKVFISAVCICLALIISVSAISQKQKNEQNAYKTVSTAKFEIGSNRHTQYRIFETVSQMFTTDGFECVLENDNLAVWYNKSNTSLRVVNKKNGYVWGCLDESKAIDLNDSWIERANSVCTITYFDEANTEKVIASGNSKVNFSVEPKDNVLNCSFEVQKFDIYFEFKITLKDNALAFEIDDSSIEGGSENVLKNISFLNFFGSSREDEINGYFLIPDGCGALMRFNKSQSFNSGYEKQFYGLDLGIDKSTEMANLNGNRTDDYATEEYQPSLPVMGIVHGENQNGVLITVDSGEEYASVFAHPSGLSNINYNRAYITYKYRSLYDCRVSNSRTITMPENKLNSVKAKQTYYFLADDDASYSSMAVFYRKLLLEKKVLPKTLSDKSQKTKMLLNIAVSDVKKGFLSNTVTSFTNADETLSIIDSLKKDNVTDVDVVLSGWLKGGYHGSDFETVSVEKLFGNKDDLKTISKSVSENGGRLFLNLNAVTANKDQVKLTFHAALNATKDVILKDVPNKSLLFPRTYFIKPTKTLSYIKKATKDYNDYNFLYENLGKFLYSDYTPENKVNRSTVKKAQTRYFSNRKKGIMLDYACYYLLPYTDSILDTPLVCSQYLYETDSVPFLQMVLHGSVNMYAPYSNQGYYSQSAMLKMIEYGTLPSYILMKQDNFALYDTPMVNYFSLCYDDWRENINKVYSGVSEALSSVATEEITEHRVIEKGIYKTTFGNKTEIYVNYNEYDYTLPNGKVIGAVGFLVDGE